MKLYYLVKKLLIQDSAYRNSDKKLMWRVWGEELRSPLMQVIDYQEFLKVSTPESVTRARRMVQQDFKELQASEGVRKSRRQKQNQKGTYVYREYVFDDEKGIAYEKA